MQEVPANFEFGEVPITSTISSSKRATPDELVKLAQNIWKKIKESKVPKDDEAGNDKLLEILQDEFKDFNMSFPLILRWMVQMRKFSSKAFEKYLLKHASVKLDSREAFLELQADYLVLLYRSENAHPDESYVKKYRASIIKNLLDEDKLFLEVQKEVEKDLARDASIIDIDRRAKLYEFLLNQKSK
jgi:hypothetical protein